MVKKLTKSEMENIKFIFCLDDEKQKITRITRNVGYLPGHRIFAYDDVENLIDPIDSNHIQSEFDSEIHIAEEKISKVYTVLFSNGRYERLKDGDLTGEGIYDLIKEHIEKFNLR